ncbi:serine hydrolase, partial [Elizabethkingia meningoseptica]
MLYIFIILIIGFITVYLAWTHPYLFTAIRKTYFKGRTGASIFDGQDFPSRIIENSVAIPWEKAESYNQSELPSHLLTHLNKTETVSFLVTKNGKLCYENYWRGNNKDSKTNSFSMAKSITVMLLGNAIQDGKIKSVEVKLSELYPGFKDD